MKIALAQINPTVGDLTGNRKLVEEAAAKAARAGADLVVLPEMAITGYPPMDLLERDGFVRDQLRELDALLPASKGIAIALGAVQQESERHEGRADKLVNAGVLLAGGKQLHVQPKTLLPSYDVFDEKRYFAPAQKREVVQLNNHAVGIAVCEDTWFGRVSYDINPIDEMVREGASLILNPSASPWHAGKGAERRQMLVDLARDHQVPVVFVNQVGGNDELIFDGGSFAVDPNGRITGMLPNFESGLSIVEFPARQPLKKAWLYHRSSQRTCIVSSHSERKAFRASPQNISCPKRAVCVIRFGVGQKSAVAAGGRSCHQSPKSSVFTPPNGLSLSTSQC